MKGFIISIKDIPRHGITDYLEKYGAEYIAGYFNGHFYKVFVDREYGFDMEILNNFDGDESGLVAYILNSKYLYDKNCRYTGFYWSEI